MILHHLDLVRYYLLHIIFNNLATLIDTLLLCQSLSWSGSSVSIDYREVGFYWLLQCNLLGERLVTLGLAGAGYLRSANPGDSTHNPHEHNLTASPYTPIFTPLPFFSLSDMFALSFHWCPLCFLHCCHVCGLALVSFRIRIRIQLFISVRIRTKVAKPMLIHVGQDPAPDPGQTLKSQMLNLIWKKVGKR